jgi:hypothetical protein
MMQRSLPGPLSQTTAQTGAKIEEISGNRFEELNTTNHNTDNPTSNNTDNHAMVP